MAEEQFEQSIPARELGALLDEIIQAKKENHEIPHQWDLYKLLSPLENEYDVNPSLLPTDKYDRVFGAIELVVLKLLVDIVEGTNRKVTLRGKVSVRGVTLLWGYYFGKIPSNRRQPGVNEVAKYFATEEAVVETKNAEKESSLNAFVSEHVKPFLKLRIDCQNPESGSTILKNCTIALHEAFEGVLPVGQHRSMNIARDAVAKVILASNPELFTEETRKSIPEKTGPLAEFYRKSAALDKSIRVATPVPFSLDQGIVPGEKIHKWTKPKAKDAGLDILCFRPFPDGRVAIPVYLLQCASGEDFEEKLHTPEIQIWIRVIDFVVAPNKAFATPFAFADNDFVMYSNRVKGLFIDRYRILSAGYNSGDWISPNLKQRLIEWSEERIEALPRRENVF